MVAKLKNRIEENGEYNITLFRTKTARDCAIKQARRDFEITGVIIRPRGLRKISVSVSDEYTTASEATGWSPQL